MKTFELPTGETVKVDDDMYELCLFFEWRVKRNPCGACYARARLSNGDASRTTVWLHRFITDAPDGTEVNHCDTDGLNNQRENIEVVTPLQNRRGPRRKAHNCSSKYRGVCWDKRAKRWAAAIRRWIDGKKVQFHLGRFNLEEDAARKWNMAATEFGFLPSALNQIPPRD